MHEPIRAAVAHLAACDPVMADLIRRCGPCTLGVKRREPFHILATSIISQQLSTKAADTIAGRLRTAVGARAVFRPHHFTAATQEQLRACGLSNAKAQWLRALARAAASGTLSFRRLARMDDESAIEALDALPGIGRWTAEMFLIFALGRLDVFAMDDVGLRRMVDRLYANGRRLSDRRTFSVTRAWAPYRSVASWYLWRSIDGVNDGWA